MKNQRKIQSRNGMDYLEGDEFCTNFLFKLGELEAATDSARYADLVENRLMDAFAELNRTNDQQKRCDCPVFIGDYFGEQESLFIVGVSDRISREAFRVVENHLTDVPGFETIANTPADHWGLIPWGRFNNGRVYRYGTRKRSWIDERTSLKVIRRQVKVI